MKYVPASDQNFARLELTRRNLQTLLDKLDDPESKKTLIAPTQDIIVVAVEDDDHYSDRPPGPVFMPTTHEWRF